MPAHHLKASGATLGALLLATLVCCLLPCSAEAKHVIAPPGNAGVEQYVEVVPGAEGGEPVGGHSGKGDAISQSTRRRLEALGPEGRAAAAFARATGSSARHNGKAKHRRHVRNSSSVTGGGKGGSGGSAGTHSGGHSTATAGGGLGIGLPLALALIALLALGGALLRRRSLPS